MHVRYHRYTYIGYIGILLTHSLCIRYHTTKGIMKFLLQSPMISATSTISDMLCDLLSKKTRALCFLYPLSTLHFSGSPFLYFYPIYLRFLSTLSIYPNDPYTLSTLSSLFYSYLFYSILYYILYFIFSYPFSTSTTKPQVSHLGSTGSWLLPGAPSPSGRGIFWSDHNAQVDLILQLEKTVETS